MACRVCFLFTGKSSAIIKLTIVEHAGGPSSRAFFHEKEVPSGTSLIWLDIVFHREFSPGPEGADLPVPAVTNARANLNPVLP